MPITRYYFPIPATYMVHFSHVSYAVYCERERPSLAGSIYAPIAVPIREIRNWRIFIELRLWRAVSLGSWQSPGPLARCAWHSENCPMILGATRRGAVKIQLQIWAYPCEGKRPQTMNRPHDAGPSVISVPSFSHSARTRLRSSANLATGSRFTGSPTLKGSGRTTSAYPHDGALANSSHHF
ncbi:hypothetical protein HMPREF1287_00568 [Corynebacterium sp. KPL1986]|nr:hypothetical protein HMPREF1293_01396 [Corynebacterium sp. KPL1996]ERS44087.1 hypothetical protein HMPREF1287_00568 [Corynebacterium sp. KPL1986]ERS52281.1 hypothetical protein HMPREF1267_01420 [Corynebacterium sp. KPL1824]ERS72012.1 hypothetical protein HMPREF1295_00927 [Corynebacterium sp. KPL1998]